MSVRTTTSSVTSSSGHGLLSSGFHDASYFRTAFANFTIAVSTYWHSIESWMMNGTETGGGGGYCGSDTTNRVLFQCQCLERQLYEPKVPYPAWDYNWDGKMTDDTSMDGHLKGKIKKLIKSKKTRHIILIRHGQYDREPKNDSERKLTPLGRIQAIKTGKRLANMIQELPVIVDMETKESPEIGDDDDGMTTPTQPLPLPKSRRKVIVRSSDMERAKETAQLIAKEMESQEVCVSLESPDVVLNEVLPAPFVPVRSADKSVGDVEQIDEDQAWCANAFEKYFYRRTQDNPVDDPELHEFEIIVCHANIIRYFFCRALQIPPEAWSRMSLYNCSLTYLTIKPNGLVAARMLGDIGHFSNEESTFANVSGFRWS